MSRTASSGSSSKPLSPRQVRARQKARAKRAHERHVQKTYGLAPGQYDEMFQQQDGRCAVCGRRSRRRLAVEHSHITNTVRGLVCFQCNRDILGPLDGDPARIQRAIDFLVRMKDDLVAFQAQARPGLPGPPVEAQRPQDKPMPLRPLALRR